MSSLSSSVSSTTLTPGSRPSTLIADSTTVKCLTLLQAHNYAYVIPIIRWGEAIQQELSEGWSRVIQHDLTGNSTVTAGPSIFPVYIGWYVPKWKYERNGVARHGYAADAPFIDFTTGRSIPLLETLRYRVKLSLV